MCGCLLATLSFQCIGGGSVPPPMPCRTLGRAARRKARRLALAEAPILFSISYCVGKTLKSVNVCLQRPVFNALGAAVCCPRCLAGRWAGRRAERRIVWPWRRRRFFFSLSYCVGKTLKFVNVCLQCPVFNALGVAVCCPRCLAGRWAGRRAERRVAWPWRRPECNFLSCFGRIVCGKCVAGVKQVCQCSVLLAVWRRYELRLLKLHELFSFADTLADFNAAEQRQPGQQGRVKRPNIHSSAK